MRNDKDKEHGIKVEVDGREVFKVRLRYSFLIALEVIIIMTTIAYATSVSVRLFMNGVSLFKWSSATFLMVAITFVIGALSIAEIRQYERECRSELFEMAMEEFKKALKEDSKKKKESVEDDGQER